MARSAEFAVRDPTAARRSGLIWGFVMMTGLGVFFAVVAHDVPVVLVFTVGMVAAVMIRLAVVARTWWTGPVVLAVEERGIGIPMLVPWSQIVGVSVGAVAACPPEVFSAAALPDGIERHLSYPPPVPAPVSGTLVIVAIEAQSSVQRHAFATDVATIEKDRGRVLGHDVLVARGIDTLLAYLRDRQQAWSAQRQPVGFHVVVADELFDGQRFAAVVAALCPRLAVTGLPVLPAAALDTPHAAARRLAARTSEMFVPLDG